MDKKNIKYRDKNSTGQLPTSTLHLGHVLFPFKVCFEVNFISLPYKGDEKSNEEKKKKPLDFEKYFILTLQSVLFRKLKENICFHTIAGRIHLQAYYPKHFRMFYNLKEAWKGREGVR